MTRFTDSLTSTLAGPASCSTCGGPVPTGDKFCGRPCYLTSRSPKSLAELYWRNVIVQPGCWGWRIATVDGYGVFGCRGRIWRAHRASWTIHFGPIPAGLCVLHHCDNPPCTNPEHLWIGTIGDNNRDAVRKGRSWPLTRPELLKRGDDNYRHKNRDLLPRGSQVSYAKLTEAIVRDLRSRPVPRAERLALARRLGVNQEYLRSIIRGVGWGHVR
jgi:hypothetical protein